MSSRLVGLLPIMWIALILHLPPWAAQFYSGVGTPASRTVCPVLYVVGLQPLTPEACHEYGPNR